MLPVTREGEAQGNAAVFFPSLDLGTMIFGDTTPYRVAKAELTAWALAVRLKKVAECFTIYRWAVMVAL